MSGSVFEHRVERGAAELREAAELGFGDSGGKRLRRDGGDGDPAAILAEFQAAAA